MPLRLRLTLWYLATLAVLLLLLAVSFYWQVRLALIEQVDTTLELAGKQALAHVDVLGEASFHDDQAVLEEINRVGNNLIVQLVSTDGTVHQRLADDAHVIPEEHGARVDMPNNHIFPHVSPTDTFVTQQFGPNNWRVYSQPVPDATNPVVWLQVAQSLEVVDSFLADLLLQMTWSVPLVLLLAGGGGYWLAVRALRPIDRITGTAQAITAQDLTQRINYRGTADEVGRLANTFDNMLERLQAAFERERRFTSDAAHELRTPLTALKGNIDVTLSRPREPGEYAAALQDMGQQAERLIRLSNDLLFMARFDRGQYPLRHATVIDVDSLLGALIDQMRPLADKKQINLTTEVPSGLTIKGDLDLLIRLFLNLLDNATKYTPEYGTVTVSATADERYVIIRVTDTGAGIAPEHIPHLFDRFYRVEQDRTRQASMLGGAGLGLAIAYEIAQAHGGTLLVESELDRGTTITVQLPIA